jgi:DNA polymerase III epsilon subunit family exonuclease
MRIIDNYTELYNIEKPMIVFDLETTGLNPQNERIIEIGAYKIVNGEVVDKISTLVNPGIPVPYYASKVNGITTDMLEGQISDLEGVELFLDMAKDCYIVAHNVSFDVGFINSYLIRMGRDVLTNKLVDTVKLARKAFPGRKKYSLGIIAHDLGIQVLDAHRAEDDTRVCFELYKKSIEQLKNMEKN